MGLSALHIKVDTEAPMLLDSAAPCIAVSAS